MSGAGTSALSQDEAFARIRLLRSPNMEPVSYAQLLARFGTATDALEALPDLGKRGARSYRALRRPTGSSVKSMACAAGARHPFHDQPAIPHCSRRSTARRRS